MLDPAGNKPDLASIMFVGDAIMFVRAAIMFDPPRNKFDPATIVCVPRLVRFVPPVNKLDLAANKFVPAAFILDRSEIRLLPLAIMLRLATIRFDSGESTVLSAGIPVVSGTTRLAPGSCCGTSAPLRQSPSTSPLSQSQPAPPSAAGA